MKLTLGILIGFISAQFMFMPLGTNTFNHFTWKNDGLGDFRSEEYRTNRELCLYRHTTPEKWHTGADKIGCINRINKLFI